MSEEVQRMVAELLAQRLGLHGGDMTDAPMGEGQIMAAVALSLLQRSRARRGEEVVAMRRVAAMVGACPRCLGDDASCLECAGKGKPGYRAPDGAALLEWIAGPLDRLGLCVSARSQQPGEHNHVGGYRQ